MPRTETSEPAQQHPRCVLAFLAWSTGSLWHGLRAYARDAGWYLISPEHYYGPPKPSKKVDGVIVLPDPNKPFNVRRTFPKAKIVDLVGNGDLDADGVVSIDHEKVGRMAADYMYSLGRSHYLGLNLTDYNMIVDTRIRAFQRRIEEIHTQQGSAFTFGTIHYDGLVRNNSARSAKLKRSISEAIEQTNQPISVFCPDDSTADVFLQEVLSLGYKVPERIAILGVNNNRSFCELSQVPLSSVDVNLSKLGHTGAELLDRYLNSDPKAPKTIFIPPLYIEKRASTEQITSDDKIVASILSYIKDHYMERITADDVIRDVHASRTNAFVRFRKSTGHSIGREIERVRLENAKSLLASTDYKIDVVARLSGYMNTSAFCRVFRKSIGKTPTEHRKEAAQNYI
ncbi:MAG: substrate-binding domain-containing protein [Verrucomicrobiota bacterium JB024]|nr:substrate-binding domain-containing protein [Verrucomicrobiota bacterium JB024]